MFSSDKYPEYVHGPAYVLSRKVAQKLVKAAYTEPFINIEDTYVTGILAQKIGVKPLQTHFWTAYPLGDKCGCRGSVFQSMNDIKTVPGIMQNIFDANVQCTIRESGSTS